MKGTMVARSIANKIIHELIRIGVIEWTTLTAERMLEIENALTKAINAEINFWSLDVKGQNESK